MKIENCLYKTLVCLLLSIFGATLVASDNGIDKPRVTPPHCLDSNDKPIVLNLPPTGTGRPIMKTRMERMQEKFDGLIYDNKVDEMSSVLSDPDLFTAEYGLPAMTAQELCNMKRKNGNMSLHLVAGRAYEDVSMAKLLFSYGADFKAKNKIHWTPLHHPSNVNFSKHLILRGANFMRVDREASPAMLAKNYKNEEKETVLKFVNDLLVARDIMKVTSREEWLASLAEGEISQKKMSSEIDKYPLLKHQFLLDAIFLDRNKPSFKTSRVPDEVPAKILSQRKKTSLESINEESLNEESLHNEPKNLMAKQPVDIVINPLHEQQDKPLKRLISTKRSSRRNLFQTQDYEEE